MSPELAPGALVGAWRVEALLGSGATGAVYRARKGGRGPVRALKVLHAPASPEEAAGLRLEREVKLLLGLRHPRIVRLLAAFEAGGHRATVSELVDGTSLAELLAPAVPLARVHRLLRDVTLALSYLHAKDILHRDLKPSNVMVDRRGRARLVDFGLARRTAERTLVTSAGQIKASLLYVAPEVLLRQEAGPASDLYSLGILAHELLCGTPPFPVKNAAQLVNAHLTATPPGPSTLRPELPAWWDRIVAKLLGKTPEARYASAAALLHDLDELAAELV